MAAAAGGAGGLDFGDEELDDDVSGIFDPDVEAESPAGGAGGVRGPAGPGGHVLAVPEVDHEIVAKAEIGAAQVLAVYHAEPFHTRPSSRAISGMTRKASPPTS